MSGANQNMNNQVNGNLNNITEADIQAGQAQGQSFAVTTSAMALWNYAHQIVQDNLEHMQTQLNTLRPHHPPILMLHWDKCLLALMVEDKCDVLVRLWQELNDIESLLGVEHI
ncbi:hypothetical protein BD769DRAFT_1395085 [Suillus cothurnatus]|nr:hypothetical protein BD769DRAFT_1395085 [Suillus cothurnatus]